MSCIFAATARAPFKDWPRRAEQSAPQRDQKMRTRMPVLTPTEVIAL
jgi:hypothetical protein